MRLIRFLPLELPSHKDTSAAFVGKASPYALCGMVGVLLLVRAIPTARQFPEVWLQNLDSLPNWFDKVVDVILTLVFLSALSYSLGVAIVEVIWTNIYSGAFWVRQSLQRLSKSRKAAQLSSSGGKV